MIYLDNSATTLQKPPGVGAAMQQALAQMGNPGRGSAPCATAAARAVYGARAAIARLMDLDDPLKVAFTSGATESLNLVLAKLVGPGDAVITTVLEHNSVLRPLYQTGCTLDVLDCDDDGNLRLELLAGLLRPNTRLMVCTHGSNLLGSVAPLAKIRAFCQKNNLVLVLDAAQTLGSLPLMAGDADYICFTGHKGLYGPQGTGGVVATGALPATPFKTGGTGMDSFAKAQPAAMPDAFEAGTPNVPGLAGLAAGAAFVAETGLEAIHQKELALARRFWEGLQNTDGVTLYGAFTQAERLPVVALNVNGMGSEDVSLALWESFGIVTRPGSHCAPLAHQRFGTQKQGMVRFSFSYFNTPQQVDTALEALRALAKRG